MKQMIQNILALVACRSAGEARQRTGEAGLRFVARQRTGVAGLRFVARQCAGVAGLLMVAGLLLVGCKGDDGGDGAQGAQLLLSGVTRGATGEGENGNVMAYLHYGTTVTGGLFNYTGGDTWASDLTLSPSSSVFRMYGFMPYDPLMTSTLTSASSDGAVLTIDNVDPVGATDLCVVTGVRAGNTPVAATPERGTFYFDFTTGSRCYVRLLMDHLMGRVLLQLRIGSEYHRLRGITLKKLQLRVAGMSKVTATVTLRRDVGIQYVGYSSGATADALYDVWSGKQALTESYAPFLGANVAVSSDVLDRLSLVATYDIYDAEGNPIRRNETAENTLSAAASTVRRGEEKTIRLTVEPSYLYVLSDWDAPTFKVDE